MSDAFDSAAQAEEKPSGAAGEAEPQFEETELRESSLRTLLEHPTTQDLDPVRVRQAFRSSEVWVLGLPAGEVSNAGHGSESEILHFSVDEAGEEEMQFLLAFTSVDTLRQALLRNPEWAAQMSVLQVDGGALLENIEKDVVIVVNPWTPLEYEVGGKEPDRGTE